MAPRILGLTLATLALRSVGIILVGTEIWERSRGSESEPQEYLVHTATRAPIADDVVITDGDQFCAASEESLMEFLSLSQGGRFSEGTGVESLRSGLHLRVIDLGVNRLRVHILERDQNCWLPSIRSVSEKPMKGQAMYPFHKRYPNR